MHCSEYLDVVALASFRSIIASCPIVESCILKRQNKCIARILQEVACAVVYFNKLWGSEVNAVYLIASHCAVV